MSAFVIWAAVAATAVFWILRLSASSPSAPAHTVAVSAVATPRGDLARVLGAPAPAAGSLAPAPEPALASRFKLLGVAAPREGGARGGLALIAVDGKPARSFKVGAPIDGELVLQEVHQRGAALGAHGAAPRLKLELPPLALPNTGSRLVLPPAAVPPAAGANLNLPGGGPIATLPAPVAGVPPLSETQEPPPVPPPRGANNNTR
jgi:general secretion pathway protein C